MKFTFYAYFTDKLKNQGPVAAAEFAKAQGFSSVELLEFPTQKREIVISDDEKAKALKAALDEKGLSTACYSIGINIFEQNYEICGKSAEDILKRCAENAAILGCPYLHHTLTIGLKTLPFDAPMTFEGIFNELCDRAERIAKYASSLGVTVIYEPQGPFVNGVKNFGIFFDEMKRRGCDVKICGDIGNCLFVDEAPELFFKKFAKDIVHVHLKDYIINRQDEMPELLWDKSKGGNMLAETEIGTGIIDFDICMQALKEAGYHGSFALESVLKPYRESQFARDMAFMEENYPFF